MNGLLKDLFNPESVRLTRRDFLKYSGMGIGAVVASSRMPIPTPTIIPTATPKPEKIKRHSKIVRIGPIHKQYQNVVPPDSKVSTGMERWTPLAGPIIIGGSVADLAMDDRTFYGIVNQPAAEEIWMGQVGKVFKSTNSGENWTPIYSPTTKLQALALAHGNLYVAGWGHAHQASIYRSPDGGDSWDEPEVYITDRYWNGINAITVNPDEPSTLYAVGMESSLENPNQPDGVVLRSMDDGIMGSWTRVLTVPDGAVFYDLAVDPTDTDFILACGGSRTGGFLHFSDDGGENWREVFTQSDKFFTSMAFEPSGVVYALSGLPGHGPMSLFRSKYKGFIWQEVLSNTAGPFALEPPNNVWVAEPWGKIRRSPDVGDSWKAIGDSPGGVQRLVIDLTSNPFVLYAGLSNRGVWRSTNGRDWTEANDGLELPLMPTTITVDPKRSNYLYTAGGYPGGFRSIDGGDSWQQLRDVPHLYDFAIHPHNTDRIYAGADCDCATIWLSTDSGEKWIGLFTPPVIALGGNQTIRKLVISPIDPSVLYAAGVNNVPDIPPQGIILRSNNGGFNWTLALRVPTRRNGFDVLAVSPTNPNIAFAAVENCSAGYDRPCINTLYRTTNGIDWAPVPDIISNRLFTSVVIDRQDDIYVADEGYLVQKSTDGGDSWRVICQPPMTREDPPSGHLLAMDQSRNLLYLAGMGWVGQSRDGGNTWEHLSDGLPRSLNPTALTVGSRTLYLGGNGIWTYTLPLLESVYIPLIE